MSHTLIPTSEIEELCEEALQSKFCAIRNDLLRAEGMRTMALASLQTVQAELNRKRALKSRYPAPRWLGPPGWCAGDRRRTISFF